MGSRGANPSSFSGVIMAVDLHSLIAKLGKEEAAISSREFVGPIFNNRSIATRIQSIVHTFSISSTSPGWYRFRPVDLKKADILGPADLAEVEQYLSKLVKLRATLSFKQGNIYHVVVDKGHSLSGQALPLFLTDDSLTDFDRVICRWDGCNLWYDRLDTINDPAKAEYLRGAMSKLVDPKSIKFSGLLFDEKAAYALRVTMDKTLAEEIRSKDLKRDVQHAGGSLVKYVEKSDHYLVTYDVDGFEYTSTVSKDPAHQVITAGVCLSGTDSVYDLKSLVTVMREGHRIGRFRGNRMSDVDYDYEEE